MRLARVIVVGGIAVLAACGQAVRLEGSTGVGSSSGAGGQGGSDACAQREAATAAFEKALAAAVACNVQSNAIQCDEQHQVQDRCGCWVLVNTDPAATASVEAARKAHDVLPGCTSGEVCTDGCAGVSGPSVSVACIPKGDAGAEGICGYHVQ